MLIPARYGSSRFPGKPLATIAGKSMISRVFAQSQKSQNFQGGDSSPQLQVECAVVTDDQRIEDHLKEEGAQVVRVDEDVQSGTERIYLAWQKYFSDDVDFIINVQGDEPLLVGDDLGRLIHFHHKSPYDITTLVREKTDFEEFRDPNRVKAVYNPETGECPYFSRAPVPYDREGDLLKSWYLHIGVYCYRPEALKKFCEHPVGYLENIEKLEQLRALGLGMRLGALPIEHDLIGVDSPEDILKVEGALK